MPFAEQIDRGTPTVTNVQHTGQATMSPTMKTYYNTELLENARDKMVLMQFADRQKIKGGRVEWRKFETFDYMPSDVKLQEGVIPAGTPFAMSKIDAAVHQYGAYTPISDRLEMEAIDPIILGCTEEHAARAAEVMETVLRNNISAGTFAVTAPKKVDGAEVAVEAPEDLDKSAVLTGKLIAKMAAWMKKNKVPKINGYWNWYLHPDNTFDLREDEDWKKAHENGEQEEIFNGEIGRLHGFRFIESNMCKVHAPEVISDGENRLVVAKATTSSTAVVVDEALTPATPATPIPCYAGGVENTVVKIEADASGGSKLTLGTAVSLAEGAVICGQGGTKSGTAWYDNLCFGTKSFGCADPEGENMEMIIKDKGEIGGPLNQFSTVGWKAAQASTILYPERIIRVECGSALGDEEESN